MNMTECAFCRRPKAGLACGQCEQPLCKSCAIFLPEDSFTFLPEIAPALRHTYYCQACHDEHVQPERDRYEATLEAARGVFVFFTTQKLRPTLLKKAVAKARVEACPDRDETILRLAFLAARDGHNAIVDTEVVAQKLRNHGYQKSSWQGSGLPATVDGEKLDREAARDFY